MRGKQKRSLGDIRTIATALESYAVDNKHYPIQPVAGPVARVVGELGAPPTSPLRVRDGWNRDIEYVTDALGATYTLISHGKDGVTSGPRNGPTTDYRHDIVFSDGSFVTWPEGAQN